MGKRIRLDLPRSLKRILPQSLFGRALLILVLPTIIVQLIATYIFYDRHWENVSRWMASSLAGEIALLVHEVNGADAATQQQMAFFARKLMHIRMEIQPEEGSERFLRKGRDVSPILFADLQSRLNRPFSLELVNDEQDLLVRVKLEDQILAISVTRKRLVSSTTYIFITWMLGSALLLTGIAVIFLRNQIRPITKLSTVMDAYGRGHDTPGFRPQGAAEVRRAGRAFQQMRQRIDRQISARMEMLAGISHDLRTPLTRMKLQLEMLGEKEAAHDLRRDVSDMEYMIGEYLDFVRGEGQEAPQRMRVADCMEDIVARYKTHSHPVTLDAGSGGGAEADIRPHVFRRAVMNIIDNGLRYGKSVRVSLYAKRHHIHIRIDDDGPGIPREKREAVFRPFTRLDGSRNAGTGGVGLGLTISRDIIHGHGGDISLQEAPSGGLRVIIRLPRL